MKKILLLLVLCGCECKVEKCGVITKITSERKHGYVLVKYPDGSIIEESKRRPRKSDIGKNYCYCEEFK